MLKRPKTTLHPQSQRALIFWYISIILGAGSLFFTLLNTFYYDRPRIALIDLFGLGLCIVMLLIVNKMKLDRLGWMIRLFIVAYGVIAYLAMLFNVSQNIFVFIFVTPALAYCLTGKGWGTFFSGAFLVLYSTQFQKYNDLIGADWVGFISNNLFIYISIWGISAYYEQTLNMSIRYLHQQATTDSLTGAFNRKLLQQHYDASSQGNQWQNSTLIMFDIDHFKHINDTYGHEAGDQVLITLVHFIKSQLGEREALFRLGGEEFCILLDDCAVTEAADFAEQLRSEIETLPLEFNGQSIRITASFGVTSTHQKDMKDAMRHADHCLYEAKSNGRNQVCS